MFSMAWHEENRYGGGGSPSPIVLEIGVPYEVDGK